MKRKYNHGGAFCMMLYYCPRCETTEMIWNSRDGVTPFLLKCNQPKCDEKMHSVAHDSYVRIRELTPIDNIRVFVDYIPGKKMNNNVNIITYQEYTKTRSY